MIDFDCTQLPEGSRSRSICEGTSGLPETGPGNTREGYIALWTNSPPPKEIPIPTACVYRSIDEIDRIQCPTCDPQFKREVKVFACQLFSRCVLKAGTSERYCGKCESRLEKQPETD